MKLSYGGYSVMEAQEFVKLLARDRYPLVTPLPRQIAGDLLLGDIMSYNDNVYYSPEKYGLTPVGEIEWDGESYQFNITAVWRHQETGDLYYADDSGCSCPAPFETYDSLDELNKATRFEVIKHLEDRLENRYQHSYGSSKEEVVGDMAGLISKLYN